MASETKEQHNFNIYKELMQNTLLINQIYHNPSPCIASSLQLTPRKHLILHHFLYLFLFCG